MAVRFLPVPGSDASAPEPERGDLAEVIDLRSRLARPTAEVTRLRAAIEEIEVSSAPPAEAVAGAERTSTAALDEGDPVEAPTEAPRLSEEQLRTAADDGVRLLARRAQSSDELRRELVRLGHDAHEADATVLDFETSLYLDDLGLARVLAEGLRERKRASRTQIRMKLRERLLPDGVIEEVLGELDDDEELELLRAAAVDRARRLAGLDRQTAERRLLGFLARRGWSGERAVRAAREALDAHGSGRGSGGPVRFR